MTGGLISYPSLLIPKLECDFFDFDPSDQSSPKYTVKSLKALCKVNGLTQVGLKADLMQKLQDSGHWPVPGEGKHPIGPRWFWFDEAFGKGAHCLYYMCICGAPMSLEPRFGVSPHTSIVAPSIMCGNKECEFHIWGKLLDFHDKTKDKPEAYYYTYNRFMNYDHERDSWSSGVFNKSKRRKGY